ncbi:MAG: CAP domain-containing protein [Armatimonadetes bacterium]|nr:CAP domain-containing protein [Armatimonadota bacterium]
MSCPRSLLTRTAARIILCCLALGVLAALGSADLTGTQVATKPTPTRLPQPAPQASATAFEQTVFDKINAVRKEHALPPVRFASDLLAVARRHSEDQARRNILTHVSADGRNAGARLDAAQVGWVRYGENVALVKGYSDPAATVVDAWMRSPGHAANVLDGKLVESAIGVAQSADGTYFITQDFVTR